MSMSQHSSQPSFQEKQECPLYKIFSFLQTVPPEHLGVLIPGYLLWTSWILRESVKFMKELRERLKLFKHEFHRNPADECLQNEYFHIMKTVRHNYYEIKQRFTTNEKVIQKIRSYLISELGEESIIIFLAPLECIPRVVGELLGNILNGIRELNRIRRKQRFMLKFHNNICIKNCYRLDDSWMIEKHSAV